MIMAFNGNGAGGGQDGPHTKRLCTGQEMIETVPLNSRAYFPLNNNNNINVTDEPRRKREVATRPNHILLFTIINPVYPITVDVLHTICQPNGPVQRIVIFKKNGVQAMVEFDSIESATRAREALNGCDIYSGCCTLKIDYAKPEKLNVYKNDTDSSWDYTLAATKESCNGRAPLLHDPTIFGGRPTPYKPALLGTGGGNGFAPNFSPPEFHASENWKPTPAGTHVGLMKDPPIARNGPANFIQPAQQQGAVMMVYGLDNGTANTDKLFNLFCLYGNVVRIKFLKTKEGTAMVQMGDAIAVERSIQHLNNIPIGNDGCKIQIAFSKQNYLSESTNPYTLPDNSISFKDYSASKNNRFLSLTQASKNRIQPPSKILHFFNTPPGMSEDQLLTAFTSKDCHPAQVRMFPLKSERSSSGLVEFPSVALAVNAIMKCNHSAIDHKGTKFPFIMKLCFSSSKTMNGAWNNENMENMNNITVPTNPMAAAAAAAAASAAAVAAATGGVVTTVTTVGHKQGDDEPM
ncbi:heterogeneous nuclear ribonucleoprotein L isoform X3 [Toxorhynchites rutilus septentrionalis]|uniref:heterogeneous nuclear ribonucleoprotein L isoform X3 n=1 Tax=Toxorhynchites rutilus septentrionalis TaxID=329112 RepID=UPI002479C0CB|nr:heterogeneous nuclear ribonucleoprotein L isoform X3 [Toxorhynchites rutilus septentrionalis]